MKRKSAFEKRWLFSGCLCLQSSLQKYFLVLFIFIAFCPAVVLAQTKTVSGTVTDENGAVLSGVSVVAKGLSQGVTTATDGKYSITLSSTINILVFSYVGYAQQQFTIPKNNTLNVNMQSGNSALNEVVVVSYGIQAKRNVTGSIQTVNANELKDIPVAQFSQKLQGKLAGVQILQTSGQPGQGLVVRIRGQASISAGNQPLYVVDGFPITGDINNINPDEIESFSVLKDASATSLYGSRAANGVILITTKHAKAGQTNLSVSAYYGTQQVPGKGRPPVMNAEEFAQFEKEVFEAQNLPVPEDYQNPSSWRGRGTNWYDVLLRSAPIQDYSISLSSSKDKFSSAVTAGFFNQDGVLLNSNFKRYSLRANTEYKFNDRLKFGFNAAPSYTTNATANSDGLLWGGGIIESAILTSPLAFYKNEDGTLPLTATGPGLFPNPNWYRVVQETTNNSNTLRLLSNAYAELEIIKGLVFKSSVNVDLGSSFFKRWSPSTVGGIFAPPPQTTYAIEDKTNYYSWLTENTLTYKTSIGKHNLDLLAGYTSQKFKSDYNHIYAYNFPDDRIQSINAAASSIASGDVQEWTLLSYVGRINYNYDGKYLLSAAIRRDGSSRFGPNTRYGNFPSVSAGWLVSEENFMKNIAAISQLKIRGSYGVTGNNNIGNYSYYAGVTASNYAFNGTLAPGKSVTSLANDDLGWEKTKQVDIGLDLSLLQGRISFTYDYYSKSTSNLLYSVDVPLESGYSNIVTNVGEFKFWGHEFTIATQNLKGGFTWNTDFNISFNKNKVIKLGLTDAPIYGDYTITKVGEPIGQFYGYVFEGVYMNQADFDKSPKHASSTVGTVKMKDVDGDGDVDANDQTIIGNPNPKFIYGITNSLAYKNFDLSFIISGSVGNDIINGVQEFTQNLDGVFNVTKNVANRWRSESDPGDGIHPRVVVGTPLARFHNSRWVSNGSYLAVKNITLGYNLPIKNNQYFIHNARLYASVQQAFVFTNYEGANPEVNINGSNPLNQGVDLSAYPVPRTFTVGVNIGL